MIEYIVNDNKIVFSNYYVTPDGDDIRGPSSNIQDYLAFCMLRELAAKRKVGNAEEIVIVSLNDLYDYAHEEGQDYKQVFNDFGFPPIYPYWLYLDCNGPISESDFNIDIKISNNQEVAGIFEAIPYIKNGFLLQLQHGSQESYSLSPIQFQIFEYVSEINQKKSNLEQKLILLAEIKSLDLRFNRILLHPILESENVIIPESIKLDVHGDDNTFIIAPEIKAENVNKDEFIKKFDKILKVNNVYNFDLPGGGRRRVIFTNKQKKALEQIKKFRMIQDPENVRAFIQNPPIEFDEADIDVSELYSDRVKGIGIYRPKVYPFICSYKSDWLVGFELEYVDKKDILVIENQEMLNDLNHSIQKSIDSKKDYIEFKGQKIDLDSAIVISKQAEDKFKHFVNNDFKPSKEVLLIKENVEELEYYIEKKNKTIEVKDYNLNILESSKSFKEHQFEGINTLLSLKNEGYPGAILADDMGLGKTLQILAFLEYLSKNENIFACIICPVGLIENWIQEYFESFPNGNIRFHDIRHDLQLLNILDDKQKRNDYKNDVVICSYEFLRTKQFQLCSIPWDVAVLDEAQKIKTPGTLITNAAKALKAKFKIAMTGTPVENSFHDLWCIADFCMPGFLGSAKEFSEAFNLKKDDSDELLIQKGIKLREKLGNSLIRRIKYDVLKDLPPKYESDKPEHSEEFALVKTAEIMPPLQTKVYSQAITTYKTINHNESKNNMIGLLQTLKMISDHPLLTDQSSNTDSMNEEDSAKCIALLKILSKIRDREEKAIIFSEYRKTQRMLAMIINKNFHITPRIINGDTPTAERLSGSLESRSRIIGKFNSSVGFNVIIMSPIAAGVGLTVTGANHVIHFSRHWNPAKEDQATDRAYRIGQEKPVYIYYLLAKHPNEKILSFDENLAKLLAAKRKLGSAVLFPSSRMEANAKELYDNILSSS